MGSCEESTEVKGKMKLFAVILALSCVMLAVAEQEAPKAPAAPSFMMPMGQAPPMMNFMQGAAASAPLPAGNPSAPNKPFFDPFMMGMMGMMGMYPYLGMMGAMPFMGMMGFL